jgi:hypothetical protein
MQNAQAKQIMQAYDSYQANIQTCKELFEVPLIFHLSACATMVAHTSQNSGIKLHDRVINSL